MSQNPDFEETSLFDLFPAEEKKTDKKEQKNEKTEYLCEQQRLTWRRKATAHIYILAHSL